MSIFKHSVIIFLCLFFTSFQASAQTNEERRERADRMFEKEQYVEATKDYLHLLSLEPRSADLNFRYGACLLFNSNKKNESIRYLAYAVTDPAIDPRAFYFHGLALHLNYQFSEAQRSYGTYVNLTIGKTDKRYPADRQIEMCNNGKRLLTTFTDIIVAEKQEIDNEKFFRIYTDANTIGGDILVTAKFQSKMDVKMGHVPIVHFPPNASAIYYSSYGESLANGKDIYVRRRLPNGEWGDPQLLPGLVNSPFDEDFPYMHPSGNYLYFSSTGHNSMGGYDVYMSRFDPNTNTFREPENVDFAISSPDDDFFYVVDSLFQNAYFASARQSQDGMLHVYKVKVARVPLKEVIIMGEFISEVDPEMKSMEINLTYHSNGKDVGLVKSNKVGKYSYVFPQGGKYNYQISVSGLNEEYKFVVDLPFLDELRPLKQKIIHTKEDGKDVLKILNLFDEDVEGAEAIIAEVIRKKAELDVNIDEYDVDEIEEENRRKAVLAELGFDNMRPEEIVQQLEELSSINADKSKAIAQIENNINTEILAKSERIQTLEKVQQELTDQAFRTTDPIAKHNLLTEAQRKEGEKLTLINAVEGLVALKSEAVGILNSGNNDVSSRALTELKENFQSLVNSDKDPEAYELLANNKELIKNASKGTPDDLIGIYVDRANQLRQGIKDLGRKEQDINRLIESANQEINRLQGTIETAKNKDIPAIQKQIEDKKEEIQMAQVDLQRAGDKKRELAKQLATVEEQIASLQSAMNADEIIAVRNDDVERSVKSVKTISENPSGVDYQSEIARIEEESPALFNKGQLSFYDEVRTELKAERDLLAKDQKLSESERVAKELDLIEKAKAELDERQEQIAEELKSNPSEELKVEEQKISSYQSLLQADTERLQEELAVLREQNPDLAYSKDDLLKEIDPNYQKEIAGIRSSGDDRLVQVVNEIDRSTTFLDVVNSELSKTEAQFKSEPENAELEAKIELFNELKRETTAKITKLEAERKEIEAERAIKPLDPERIYPGYDQQIAMINNASLSEAERTEEERTVQNSLMEKIAEEEKRLQKELRKEPNDPELKTNSEALRLLKEQTEQRLEELNKPVVPELAKVDLSKEESFISNYPQRLSELETNNQPGEKLLTERLALNNELLTAIREELNDRRSALESDPENEQLVKELATVEGLEQKVLSRIRADEQQLDALQQPEKLTFTSRKELTDVLLPDYQDRRAEIQNDEVLSEQQRRERIVELNQNSLDQLNEHLEKVRAAKEQDPSDPQLKRTEELLTQYTTELRAENTRLVPNWEAPKERELDRILANVEEERAAIKNNSTLSEDERTIALLRTEEKLQTSINDELGQVESELRRQANNEQLRSEKEALTQALKTSEQEEEALRNSLPVAFREYDNWQELLVELSGDKANLYTVSNVQSADPKEREILKAEMEALLQEVNTMRESVANAPMLTEEERAARQQIFNSLEEALNEVLTSVKDTETVSVAKIDPDEIRTNYTRDKERISSDTTVSREDQLKELNALEQELIVNAQKELTQVDKKLKKDADDPELIARKEALQAEVSAAESRVSENEQTLAALKEGGQPVQNDEEYLASIYPAYDELMKARSEETATEKRIEAEFEFLQALNEHKAQLKKGSPKAEELERIDRAVTAQEAVYRSVLEENYSTMSEDDKLELINELVPNYSERKSSAAKEGDLNALVALEKEVQAAIEKRSASLEAQRKRKASAQLDIEMVALEQLAQESKARELDTPDLTVSSEEVAFIAQKRTENGVDFDPEREVGTATLEELKDQDSRLQQYVAQLNGELEAIELSLSEQQNEDLQQQKAWIEAEIETIAAIRRKYSVRIGELETTVERNGGSEDIQKIDTAIADANEKWMNENLSSEERKALAREIKELEKEKASIENSALEQSIDQTNSELSENLERAKAADPNNEFYTELNEYVSDQITENQKELKRIEALSDPLEQAYELQKLKTEQDQIQSVVEEALINEEKKQLQEEEQIALMDRTQLEEKKRRFVVRLGELSTELERKNEEKSALKGTERSEMEQQIETLESERAFVQKQIADVEEQLRLLGDPADVSNERAMNVEVDFVEERKIAATESYRSYEPFAAIAIKKAEQIRKLEEELVPLKRALDEVLLEEIKSGRKGSVRAGELIQEIKEKTEELDRLKIEYVQDLYSAEQNLPQNEEEAMKMRNLAMRGVKPIETAALAVALLQMPTEGFAIGERLNTGESRTIPIAVDVKQPEGLVYRVQVGAFARPIQEALFSEFTPVSGEKIEGTNITRYMAGYFNSSSKVLDARDQIRGLGYSDAFIVAYCNGKRIQFGEARRLEAAGICVPKRENEIMIEVAQNTAEHLGIPLVPEVSAVQEHDYNKAPGAAKADAIEEMQGLFFTVQIGVFNRPVGESNLYGMKDILTFRLPNGQIRYSSGMFDSFEAAVPRRTQALDNGVIGAFITAYYKGERITIQAAKKILEEQGESVLQSRQKKAVEEPKVIKPEVVEPVKVEEVKPVEEAKMRVQIVTKKTFDTYPRDILNRYNTEGMFFYDESDGKVKSAIYPDEDHLPRLMNFRKDIDTVYIPVGLLADEDHVIMELKLQFDMVPGDLMDWMLRFNKRRTITRASNGAVTIRFMGITAEERTGLESLMNTMGYIPEFVNENELELELNNKQ